jgi:ATP-dependent exoDNAse (exonuclease V) beta subunit
MPDRETSLVPAGEVEARISPLPPGEGEGEGMSSEPGMYATDPADPPVLEGIIDLIFEEPSGGLVIIDYKTDGVRDAGGDTGDGKEQLAKAAAPYIPQLGAYALATEQATGRRVSEAIIVFASRAAEGKDAEYHLPDLARARQEAGELAAAAFAHEN